MAIINEGIRLSTNSCESSPFWKLVRGCMANGADPRKEASAVSGIVCGWGDASGTFPKLEHVKPSGHSALSLVFQIRTACQKHEKEYKVQITTANKLLAVFTEFIPPGDSHRVSVPESVVDAWESILLDEGSHDVELTVVGCCGKSKRGAKELQDSGGGTLGAHAAVLRPHSPVLSAALSSPMQEGQTGRIQVEGVSLESTKLLLQLMYTGSTSVDLTAGLVLGTLDLAHRWQISSVIAMTERALTGMLSLETLGDLCEAAVLRELPKLRGACRSYVATSTEAQALLEKPDFPSRAKRELKASIGAGKALEPEAKRARRSL